MPGMWRNSSVRSEIWKEAGDKSLYGLSKSFAQVEGDIPSATLLEAW